jgi:hypothetical protein
MEVNLLLDDTLWDIAACGLVEADLRFRGAYLIRHQSHDA